VIDKIDRRLIIELQKDGRYSCVTLAKKLGIGTSSVSRRIRRLQKEKIIRVIAVPNPEKLGLVATAIVAMDIDIDKIDDVCSKLTAYENILNVAIAFGRYNVLIEAYHQSTEALLNFLKNELSQIDGIRNIETFYIAELKKRTYGLLHDRTPNK